ncbi:MAG: DNA polymerase IV [Eggerthellaceae bacterium]|uniref:DNA polymerase Y family protein n=1 Tax=Paraeggerthella sp. TaxID=2897350 RepID=UPI002F9F3F7F
MQKRAILHSDINCCYAQIECQANPELRDKPVVVGGDEEARHGIVLAKNLLAKKWGISTAETLRDARRKCPELVVVPPDYRLYMKVSSLARRIYYDYSDCIEPFGPDEAWIDVSGTQRCLGLSSIEIACEISERMKAELGITVSVGVSWNKIFAKFGSDYKKPDAVTAIDEDNYQDIVWKAPVRELLYVGAATERKLHSSGICTIGDLAHATDHYLQHSLGKMGFMLRAFARGEDATDVKPLDRASCDVDREVKSYGNGITFPRDIEDEQTARAVIWMLAESVAQRMREGRARARTIAIGVRSADDLTSYTRQAGAPLPTNITGEVARIAWRLLRDTEPLDDTRPLRGLCVRASNLVPAGDELQLMLFDPLPRRTEREGLDAAIDELRRRFGNNCVVWGPQAQDPTAWKLDAKRDNVVHPVSFFHR